MRVDNRVFHESTPYGLLCEKNSWSSMIEVFLLINERTSVSSRGEDLRVFCERRSQSLPSTSGTSKRDELMVFYEGTSWFSVREPQGLL